MADASHGFIIELTPSEGNTTIPVVVDRFTKMAHFMVLPGIQSAPDTAHMFIKEIVRLHRIPSNLVTDRGVRFTSRFWKSFCQPLCEELSLSNA